MEEQIQNMEEQIYSALDEIGEHIMMLYKKINSSRVTVNILYTGISDMEYSISQLKRVINYFNDFKENMSSELRDKIRHMKDQYKRAIRRAHSKIHLLEHGQPIPLNFYRFGKTQNKNSFNILQKDLERLKKMR